MIGTVELRTCGEEISARTKRSCEEMRLAEGTANTGERHSRRYQSVKCYNAEFRYPSASGNAMMDFSSIAIIHGVPKSHWVKASKPHWVFSSGDRVRETRKAHQISVTP
jgi:hypothetical protein